MIRFFNYIRNFFTREKVEPFNPDEDEFVQRMKREQEESRASLQHRQEHRHDWLSEPLSNRFTGCQPMKGDE